MSESVLRIVIDSRNAERNARNIANELQNIERNGDYASRSMDSMSVATRQLVGYMGGILTVGATISKMDAYTGLQNRLKLVTESQAELNTAMNDTFAIAQKTASSWDSTAMVYQRFADNADRLGISMKQTAALTETVSKAISVSGGSAASAEAALMQFGQALASGVLRGEEFNSIAEQAPGLLKAIAMGMDTNVGSLRAMAAEGKITGDELVKALSKAKPYIDDLFNKTDFTIAQSFTQLSNEITKFVGAAGAGSGAAAGLSAAISGLAENLGTIANIAVVGGVALLTKTIIAQTVAIYGSITGVMARRAADLAALESQAQLAGLEVQRTRRVAALAAQEVHLARLELNSALTRAERAAATMRLTQAEIALALAEKQKTAATIADTAAQNANNAARSRGAALFAMVGGWTGVLTVGVAALAAGYMYLKSRTAEANAKLEEQGKIAQETDAELRKLSGNDKISAVRDLTAAFNAQNETLAKSKESVDAVLFSIRAVSVENEAARKVTEDARNGVISYDEAIKRLNQMDIPTDLYDQLKKQVFQYNENAEKAGESQRALSALGKVVKLAGNLFQNAAVGVGENSKALGKNKTAAEEAAEAQKKFKASLFDREFEARLTKGLLAKGYSEDQVRVMIDTANFARKEGIQLTNEMYQAALKVVGIEEQNKKVIDSRNAAEKERTKELEKQQKVLTASSKVQANAAKYNFTGLESKYGLPSGTLSAIHAIETGNTGKSNQVNSQTGATGGFQFLEGTAKQYGVKDRTDLAQSAEGAAKYMSYLLKLFKGDLEKAVRAYHAGEGNVQKGKNIGKYNNDYWQKFKGYTAGTNGFTAGDVGSKDWEKLLEEAAKMAEQQAELRKNLELNVADEVTRIRSKLADDLQEIDKAGYSPERAKEIKAEYQARADNDIAIAEYALKTKLDDYESFRKTESQLLEDSFNERKFYASRDLELTKEQRDKAVALLDEQLKQEQALMKLAYETRLFQMREQFLNETVAMEQRYDLEHRKLIEIKDVKEREYKAEMLRLQKMSEIQQRLKNASQNWASIQADMNGTSELLRLSDERDYRAQQSGELADAEYQSLAQKAQDPNANMEELAAQREAIWQAHHDRMTAIESDYYTNSQALQLAGMGQVASGLSSIVGDMAGEQSSAYKAMFAIEKGFAIAQSALAIQTGVSKAIALGFPQNIPVIAQTVMEGAKIASAIRAITDTGFASGGYTGHGGKYEPAGVVHKGEGVLTQEEVKALGGPQGFEDLRKSIRRGYATGGLVADTHRVGMGAVSAINSGGGNVGGSSGDVYYTQTIHIASDGSVTSESDAKQLGKMMENMTLAVIRREQRQGGLLSK
ncbi:membrane-bound lytic murein transglycosylase D [Acinetobacter johnsonii]|uniref:tape measure protein n=1 Tax=Acinetobacter johnsonii TaxID=40214 RepID=UPI000B7C2BED|nr:tape measure protein [Acinetobacter johnsonii]SNU14107.1 membrane-bound lytic murein transglycosylase D [Acinetobacter johnsonii]